ncbi:MAG: hypothetical protein NVSMB2_17250 [Chloroflexota bacterium]
MSTVWAALARALSPVEDRPVVVPGLESARYTTRSGAAYVVVHNPAAHTYARLDPREFELLPLLDGQHTIKDLVIAYYRTHGSLALPRIAGLVELLARQGLLKTPPIDAYAALRGRLRRRAERRTTPELVTYAIDGLFSRAYDAWGRLFFRRVWLWIGLVLGALGPVLLFIESQRGRYALYEVGQSALGTVVILVVTALVALAIHELGHGLAVKHAGRRVTAAGLRLYFGLPAAYVDTSDIWMAAPRARLLTAFAGPWTGLVLGGLAAVAVSLMPTGPLGAVLYAAAFVFLADNLFNFNPLLELDGYYMLIDYFDRPLLRARALGFVRGPLWSKLMRRQALTHDERILAAFGLGAALYSVFAAMLAVRAWQALLSPIIVSNWTSGDPWRQATATLLALGVGLIVVIAVVALVQRWARVMANAREFIGGRAAARRHRAALAALRAVQGWSELPDARLLEVARAMRAQTVVRGEEVVRQGEPGERFYVIDRGTFEVQVDGRAQSQLGRGDYFGERALLQAAPRAATVVATSSGRLLTLDRSAFDALLASDLAARERFRSALAYRDDLAAMPLLRDLSPRELDLLVSHLSPSRFAPGQIVVRQGEPGDRFFIVRSGSVEVERDGEILAHLGRGESFGEIALLLDVPRTATVRATELTEILSFAAEQFRDLLAAYLGRAAELERLSHLRLSTHKRLDEVM